MSDLEGKMGVLHAKVKNMQEHPISHASAFPVRHPHPTHTAKPSSPTIAGSQRSQRSEKAPVTLLGNYTFNIIDHS